MFVSATPFGAGYFYIPGTETCLKISGYVRSDSSFGEDPYSGEDRGWAGFARGTISARCPHTIPNTAPAFASSSCAARRPTTASSTYINSAYIELAGFSRRL